MGLHTSTNALPTMLSPQLPLPYFVERFTSRELVVSYGGETDRRVALKTALHPSITLCFELDPLFFTMVDFDCQVDRI